MADYRGQLVLTPHPAAPPEAISGVSCAVNWTSAGAWALDFIVGASPHRLRLPEPATPARADDLWRTTCFELFMRRPGEAGYLEFNFSPSGLWSAWRFDGYRRRRGDLDIAPPAIRASDPSAGSFATGVALDDARFAGETPWLVNLAAVIEETGGRISYWSLAHAATEPDFHHPDSFKLRLP